MALPQSVSLFVPCFVDQFYPRAGMAAVVVLERLGVRVQVAGNAVCCGQPPANAGFAREGDRALSRLVDAHAGDAPVVVLSGSCALHIKSHAPHASARGTGASVAARTIEFCSFLHDVVGLSAVARITVPYRVRVAVHLGCHGLRGLGLATPSEIPGARVNKVHALLEQVPELEIAEFSRRDECCGFGGTFAMSEPALSVKMGQDRLRDFRSTNAELMVSPDLSCVMHLEGLARADGRAMRAAHVAELLAGPDMEFA